MPEENDPKEYVDGRLTTGAYKRVDSLVKACVDAQELDRFDLDSICRHLQVFERQNRHYVSTSLGKLVNQGKLEKLSSGAHFYYKYVNNNKRIINWNDVDSDNTLPIRWPCSHLDCSEFGFSQSIVVSQGDLIVVAGVSNMGKTTFAQNFLFENMDAFDCQMMVNEYNPGKFKRRVQKMTWGNPFRENGEPKFTLVERHEDWKYAIEPDQVNIIDWINISDGDFYKIGGIMEGIQGKLRKGIALIVLQKNEAKDLGTGGQFSEHLASVYFNIDKNRLSVRKIKEYNGHNPNGKIWGFDIDGGTDFHFIRELKPCPKCHSRCLVNKIDCLDCHSTGYVDRELATA